jgi:Na+/H+ antiporter NhaB
MIITDVAPVSATACVMGIDGFLGCMLDAHICICWLDKLSVTTVVLSLSTTMFWVGYKVGSETNEFKHFNSTCSAPHRHILGN